MKTIFTLLLSLGTLTSVFAQSGRDYNDMNRGGTYTQQPSGNYRGGYGQQPGTDNRGGYGQQPGSDNRGGYGQQPGSDNRGGYGQPPVSDNRGGYGQPPVNDNRGGYDNRGYDNRGYDNRGYDSRDNHGYDNRGYDNRGYDHNQPGSYGNYGRNDRRDWQRQQEIDRVNRDYNSRIDACRNDRSMNPYERNRRISQLERERDGKVKSFAGGLILGGVLGVLLGSH